MNSQLYHVAAADWPEMPAFLIPTFNVLVALAAVLRFLRGYIGFEQLVNKTMAYPPARTANSVVGILLALG